MSRQSLISSEEVLKIAALARLQISTEEAGQYAADLSKIVSLVKQMNAVDTQAIEPMTHPLEVIQRLREDEVTETDQRKDFQAIAPQVEKDLYLVPKVIE